VGKTGFADYLLMVHDIVQEAARRGIRTFGRGSAAASLICYLLKITYVDPIKYNLTFERFMNDSRSDMPDIDLDFPWNRRDEMVEWVYERFGKDRVAMISTFQTFRARGSVREVAKAYGVPDMDISRITKRLPYMLTDAIDSSVSTLPECRDLPLDQEPWKSVIAMARRIAGFPRHISVHPCGLVIAPSRLDKILPLEAASKGLLVTQMDMYPVEDIGLVKMDLLGQRAMAVISDSVAVVNKRYGKKISLDDLLLDDKTKRIMRTGQSMGCFYVESPGMRNLMAKLKVEGFELLTAASSVIRPGPSDSGMMKSFVERHCGREPVRYLHPAMEEILKETYGVMIYQEDVMRIAHEVAGMSLAEADKMRRAMTKKRAHEPIERMKESFLAGAAERGIEKDVAAEIWRQIAAFAGYAFCKSHSASFAQVSIQSAHLKAHYPAEFMAAVLSNDGGFYRAGAYIQEARRLGLKILPPYISKAKIGYQGGKDILMVGLMAVKSLSSKTMQRIVDRQPYGNLTEFLTRVRPARNEAESLVGAGALDRFGYSRPQLMWLIQAKEREEEAVLTGIAARDLPAPNVPDYELAERMERENDALEFTVTAHPLALYKKEAEKNKAVIAKEFSRHRGKVIAALGWLVHRKRTRTQRGDNMMFMSMEDLSDAFEAVLFPGIYDRYGGMIKGNGPYLIYGKVVSDAGVISINVQELQNLG
jgi:DNA-directed DNA polymerase III PolC